MEPYLIQGIQTYAVIEYFIYLYFCTCYVCWVNNSESKHETIVHEQLVQCHYTESIKQAQIHNHGIIDPACCRIDHCAGHSSCASVCSLLDITFGIFFPIFQMNFMLHCFRNWLYVRGSRNLSATILHQCKLIIWSVCWQICCNLCMLFRNRMDFWAASFLLTLPF